MNRLLSFALIGLVPWIMACAGQQLRRPDSVTIATQQRVEGTVDGTKSKRLEKSVNDSSAASRKQILPVIRISQDLFKVEPGQSGMDRAGQEVQVGLSLYRKGDFFNAAREFAKAAEGGPEIDIWQTNCRASAAWCFLRAGKLHSFLVQYEEMKHHVNDYTLYGVPNNLIGVVLGIGARMKNEPPHPALPRDVLRTIDSLINKEVNGHVRYSHD